MTTPEAHLARCKCRALALLGAGGPDAAVASLVSGLGDHPGTAPWQGIALVRAQALEGAPPEMVRGFIWGFEA